MSKYEEMVVMNIKKALTNAEYGTITRRQSKIDNWINTDPIKSEYRESTFGGLSEEQMIEACKTMFPENFV